MGQLHVLGFFGDVSTSLRYFTGYLQGDMLCCETCPATFHKECIGLESTPEGDWWCPLCVCAVCGQAQSQLEALPARAKQVEASAELLPCHVACDLALSYTAHSALATLLGLASCSLGPVLQIPWSRHEVPQRRSALKATSQTKATHFLTSLVVLKQPHLYTISLLLAYLSHQCGNIWDVMIILMLCALCSCLTRLSNCL